jgi:hypothetical protein
LAVWYIAIVTYLWEIFKLWIHTIFVVPFQTTDMLWLLVPVWLGWFFSEFFQEKTGTSLGNAISNAVIILWGSIDCSRQTVKLIAARALAGAWDIAARFFIIALIFAYGAFILVLGWKGNKLIKYIGRVRQVTYVFAIFTPVFYGAIPFSLDHIVAAVLFFPLFYFAIELIDRYTPNPKAIVEDMNEGSSSTESNSPAYSPSVNPPMNGPGGMQQQRPMQPGYGQYPKRPPQNPYNPYNQFRR